MTRVHPDLWTFTHVATGRQVGQGVSKLGAIKAGLETLKKAHDWKLKNSIARFPPVETIPEAGPEDKLSFAYETGKVRHGQEDK